MDHAEARRLAADPDTPLKVLHQLAVENPEVHPLLAENPSTYPDLLTWLSSRGTPEINAALARRAVTRAEATPSAEPAPAPAPAPERTAITPAAITSPYGIERHSILGSSDAAPATASQPQQSRYPQPVRMPPAVLPESLTDTDGAVATRRISPLLVALLGLVVLLAAALLVWAINRSDSGQDVATSSADTTATDSANSATSSETTASDPAATLLATANAATCQNIDTDKVALEVYAGAVEWDDTSVATVRQALEAWQTRCNAGWAVSILDALGNQELSDQLGTGWIQYARPIPASAQESDSFSAPSGNISCSLTDSDVLCTIQSYSFTPSGGTCSTGTPVSARLNSSGAALDCSLGQVSGGDALAYGSAVKLNNYVCTSQTAGVECYDALTGAGFLMRREGVELTAARQGQ